MEESKVVQIVEAYLNSFPTMRRTIKEQPIIQNSVLTDIFGEEEDGTISYIVEAKGSESPGTIAGGIGQALQYNYQKRYNNKTENARVVFACPKDVEHILVNFIIPEDIEVWVIDDSGRVFNFQVDQSRESKSELQLPGTFFIEGITIQVIKDAIILINQLGKNSEKLDRKIIQEELEKICPYLSASGHRNTLITLSTLSIINNQNTLTPKGWQLYGLLQESEVKFKRKMIETFYPFIINVLNALLEISKDKNESINNINCTQIEISKKINYLYNTNVRFFNNPRRISTVVKILEELEIVERPSLHQYNILKLIHPLYLP